MRRLIIIAMFGLVLATPCAAETLDILIFGATGNIGSKAVIEALDRGHHVTAVSRDPSQIELKHENLAAAKGDLLDLYSIGELVVGRDVVITSVRGVIGDSKTPESALQYIAVRNVVEALRAVGPDAPRLIHVGGAGSLEVEPGVLYADTLPKVFLPKKIEVEIAGQVIALDYLRTVSDVRWTCATPPKNLTNGERTGQFRIGGDQLM